MFKFNKKIVLIIGIVIGLILGMGIMVKAVNMINSSDVEYNQTTVKDAIDELYNIGNSSIGSGEIANAYGVRRNMSNSSSAWERIGLSKGKVANATKDGSAVVNDFDNIYPWSDIKSYNYDTSAKSITAWYGEDSFTFTPTDNTTEVLTYIPEFYYQRYQTGGYEYIYISKTSLPGFTKSEAFSIGRYTMSGSSPRVHSRSGSAPLLNTTITNFRNYARNLGSGFQQLDWHYFIIQLLYLVEYADYNSQDRLGLGYSDSSNTGPTTSGGCNSLGMKSGTLNNDGKHSMIYRGMENIYGNVWQFVDGINIKDHQAYINYNPSTYKENKYDGDYKRIGYINSSSDGWISKIGYDADNELIQFPILTGVSPTYITVYYHQATGNQIALVGGAWYNNKSDCFWYWHHAVAPSGTDKIVGARLLKTD